MPELANRYQRLGWGEINLDYSGTRSPVEAIHRSIAALTVDDDLMLHQEKSGAWVLSNTQGAIVGKLSRAFAPPEGMHCIQARVAAIHVRRRKDVGEEHQARLSDQCEAWEMIVPELVFAPITRK
jgi:ATP-dependent DNA helicase RecQ